MSKLRILIISGRSGSGKSTALHLLEDEGFLCIDNLPLSLLPAFFEKVSHEPEAEQRQFAIGIDARNLTSDLSGIPEFFESPELAKVDCDIVYLDTSREMLLKRFSETRRKHPLSDANTGLNEAIAKEKKILEPMAEAATVTIDTSHLNLHELRSAMKRLVVGEENKRIAIMFQSFGFKFGTPVDCDFMFDVRCLPNPYWDKKLRMQSGLESDVINFFNGQEEVQAMFQDIFEFVKKWIPCFETNNRSYLTIAIGCTGGMHRSVYLAEKLAEHMSQHYNNVQCRHRQLPEGN